MPVPAPAFETVSNFVAVKVVVTVASVVRVILHCVGTPATGAQFESKPTNLEVESGAAVKVTTVPLANEEVTPVQVVPQAIPAGLESRSRPLLLPLER